MGPAPKQFGLTDALPNPIITLYDGSGNVVKTTGQYQPEATIRAAMAKQKIYDYGVQRWYYDPATSDSSSPADSAVFMYELPAGAYSVRVTDAKGATGVALVEVYEDPNLGGVPSFGTVQAGAGDPRVVNLSTRGTIGRDDATFIGGFVVKGETSREILIRAAGPELSRFGVANPALAPVLTLFDASGVKIAANSGWSSASKVGDQVVTADRIREAFAVTGAFPFTENSRDSAILVTVPPGAYTAHVTSGDGKLGGVALLEVYEVLR